MNTTDLDAIVAVYRDMKLDLLSEGTDHGTRETREIIKGEESDLDHFPPS